MRAAREAVETKRVAEADSHSRGGKAGDETGLKENGFAIVTESSRVRRMEDYHARASETKAAKADADTKKRRLMLLQRRAQRITRLRRVSKSMKN